MYSTDEYGKYLKFTAMHPSCKLSICWTGSCLLSLPSLWNTTAERELQKLTGNYTRNAHIHTERYFQESIKLQAIYNPIQVDEHRHKWQTQYRRCACTLAHVYTKTTTTTKMLISTNTKLLTELTGRSKHQNSCSLLLFSFKAGQPALALSHLDKYTSDNNIIPLDSQTPLSWTERLIEKVAYKRQTTGYIKKKHDKKRWERRAEQFPHCISEQNTAVIKLSKCNKSSQGRMKHNQQNTSTWPCLPMNKRLTTSFTAGRCADTSKRDNFLGKAPLVKLCGQNYSRNGYSKLSTPLKFCCHKYSVVFIVQQAAVQKLHQKRRISAELPSQSLTTSLKQRPQLKVKKKKKKKLRVFAELSNPIL